MIMWSWILVPKYVELNSERVELILVPNDVEFLLVFRNALKIDQNISVFSHYQFQNIALSPVTINFNDLNIIL